MEILKIVNFKCFQEIDISLNRLTIMAGANGNGKSTAIQSLLFLRKTIEDNCNLANGYYNTGINELNARCPLNKGYLLSLGNSSYVLNRHFTNNIISIGLAGKEEKIDVTYTVGETELFLEAKRITPVFRHPFPLLKKQFYYLNAERIGSRVSQSIHFFDFPHAGYQGEYVAQLIAENNYKIKIKENRRHPENKNPRLEHQVNAWLNELMPGVNVFATQDNNTLTAQVKVENYYTKGDPTVSTNIGFGISYVLPIIATGLIAEEGSYMIVENPEAHLHPSAQSKIGRFLAMVAASGVHVIIETHSDHVVSGIQISAAKKEIDPGLITVNFFDQKEGSNQPHVEDIAINEKGELSKWPKGFFDQSQRDYAELFKIRKG